MGGENLRERSEGFGVESGDGFERDVERGNEVGNEASGLKGGNEIKLSRVEVVGARFKPLPHLHYRRYRFFTRLTLHREHVSAVQDIQLYISMNNVLKHNDEED